MQKSKRVLILPLLMLSGKIYAVTDAVSEVNNLTNIPKEYPSCTIKDNYWMEQSSPDYVNTTPVPATDAVLQANQITGQESGVHYAQGNVIGYKDDQTIDADWLIYNQQTSHSVGGNAVLYRQYNVMRGKWIDYYFDLNKGVVKEANAKDYKTNMYAEGEEIKIYNKDQFRVESGFFTSCNPNDPAWHIKSRQMDFDYQDSQGVARGATFYAESIPVAYTPYFQFPLGKRRSGFLTPEFGQTNAGTFVGVPYYWNMAPNYDMTIEPKIYSLAGLLVSDDFRYLDEYGTGDIYTEQMPSDWQTGIYRYYWHLTDTHKLAKDWTIGYNYNAVSDNNYFVDFGNFNSMVDNINLERSVFLRYSPEWGLFNVKVQGYQTLNPAGQPTSPSIYSVAPQIDFNVNQTRLGDSWLKAGLLSQYTNFTSNLFYTVSTPLQSGQRYVVYPSLTMPLETSWGHITPKFGYNDTYYQLDPFYNFQPTSSSINRQVPITSLDSGLVFDRPIKLGDSGFIQTLEPRLYYLYIPQVNQANIPAFDTAQASPNLNQLFSENRFAGYDRINSANDLTAGVTSRLLNDNTGAELSNWGMGYRYYMTPNNNLLYGSYTQFGQLYQPNPNFIVEGNNQWGGGVSTSGNFQYDNVNNIIDGYSAQVRYNPDIHKVFNVRFNYQYQMPVFFYAWSPGQGYSPINVENQYALDVSGQWPLFSEKWLLNARGNYDFTQKQFLNLLGGLEYNAGCWSVSLVYENYLINNSQYTQAYFVQLSLGGLASVGTANPLTELQNNIPGYVPVTVVH